MEEIEVNNPELVEVKQKVQRHLNEYRRKERKTS